MATELLRTCPVIAAIDFGTSYSGIAFALRRDYHKDRLHITGANFSDPSKTQTDKVPTAVLFDPDGNFHSFGQEAEDTFCQLCMTDEDEAKKWFFFHRFKMMLFDVKELTLETKLTDYWEASTMPALTVFSAAIQHLKDRLMTRLSQRMTLQPDDVDWVLTIPAIWNESAKQFMRKAAVKAGIPNSNLRLVFEPEVATLYCRVQSEEDFLRNKDLEFDLRPCPENYGKKFLVLDCGGGTVDVTVYQIDQERGELRELYRPSGGDWGGTKVDDAFLEFVYDVLGFDNVTAINQAELLHTLKLFEEAKRTFQPGQTVFLQVPQSAKVLFQHGDYSAYPQVKMTGDRLNIDSQTFLGFFKPRIDSIVSHVRSVLSHGNVQGVQTLLMVGGFSSSCLLQGAVKREFGGQAQVIVPSRASPSVLMGAVLFLLEPNVIGWRAAAYTYGVKSTRDFIDGQHDPEYAEEIEGRMKCHHIFNGFITVNEIVAVGKETEAQTFVPVRRDQRESPVPIFRTTEEDVMYTTHETCRHVGKVLVTHGDPIPDERERRIEVKMVVGCTELTVVAMDTRTGQKFQAQCDFLSQ